MTTLQEDSPITLDVSQDVALRNRLVNAHPIEWEEQTVAAREKALESIHKKARRVTLEQDRNRDINIITAGVLQAKSLAVRHSAGIGANAVSWSSARELAHSGHPVLGAIAGVTPAAVKAVEKGKSKLEEHFYQRDWQTTLAEAQATLAAEERANSRWRGLVTQNIDASEDGVPPTFHHPDGHDQASPPLATKDVARDSLAPQATIADPKQPGHEQPTPIAEEIELGKSPVEPAQRVESASEIEPPVAPEPDPSEHVPAPVTTGDDLKPLGSNKDWSKESPGAQAKFNATLQKNLESKSVPPPGDGIGGPGDRD
jgi:hypothetical protein